MQIKLLTILGLLFAIYTTSHAAGCHTYTDPYGVQHTSCWDEEGSYWDCDDHSH